MDVSSLVYCYLFIFISACSRKFGSAKISGVGYDEVIQDAKHCWKFNKAKSLYGIADRVTGKRGTIREGGAKLTSTGKLTAGNTFLTLEGTGSSIELGRYESCIGDITSCKRGFTISLWLRFRDIDENHQYVLGNRLRNTNEKGFVLLRTNNKEMLISYLNDTHEFYAKYLAVANTWYHHLITWDGKRIIVYQNGKKLLEKVQTRTRKRRDLMPLRKEDSSSSARQARNVPKKMLSLGRHGYKIDADYDDVTLWDRILNGTEAAVIYLGNIVDPFIKSCETSSSAACLKWSLPDDPFDQIQMTKVWRTSQYGEKNATNLQNTSLGECFRSLGALTSYNFSLQMKVKNIDKYFASGVFLCKTTNGVPDSPILSVREKTTTSLEIIWKTPFPAKGVVTRYLLDVREAESGIIKLHHDLKADKIQSDKVAKYVVNITNLRPGISYIVEVKAKSEIGTGKAASLTAATKDFTLVAGKFKTSVIDSDKIKIIWKTNAREVISYRFWIKPKYGVETYMDVNQSPAIINNLKPFTRYSIDIQPRYKWGLGERLGVNIVANTKDKNECEDAASNNCHANSDCFNVEESYLCQCKPGFAGDGKTCKRIPPGAKENDFCEAELFRDIFWPRIFQGGTAVKKCPKGTVGFASRKCTNIHDSSMAVYDLPNLSDCVSKEVALLGEIVDDPRSNASMISERMLKVTETTSRLYGGDVKKTVFYFDMTIREKLLDASEVKTTGQAFVDVASNLLNDSMLAAWSDLGKDRRPVGATMLVESLELLAEKISRDFRGGSSSEKLLLSNNIDLKVQRIDQATKSLDFVGRKERSKGDFLSAPPKISLPVTEIAASPGGNGASVVFFTFSNLNKILSVFPVKDAKHSSWKILNSNVVSASIVGAGKVSFKNPVVLILPHLKEKYILNTSCVFWNISKSSQSRWLNTGCYVNHTTSNFTICHCYHLTNFAVLMKVSNAPVQAKAMKHQFTLRIITFIGLSISICAMSLAFITFCCFSFLQGARTTYHKQLVLSLIIANLLFLVGIERTENAAVCTVIAILLHYFFIVAFVWMAMEGVLLYFMLKKIFSNRNFLKKKRFMALCWIVPALYIAILSSLQSKHYGNKDFCWLSRKDGFVWSFVGPVILVLLINFGVLFHALQVMCGKRKKTDSSGGFSEAWYWLKGCLVLTCLLGVTWILGLFYVDSNTIGFAYLFTILNALQGLFIFIFHCVIDVRVRREYIRLLKCQKRYEYNEKAGYSSSMKFRKWSGSIKSIGSLDRSLSHSSTKKTKSDSLDRSLLRHFQNNDSLIEAGRYTLLRSISSTRSDKSEKQNGHASESDVPFKRSIEFTTTLERNGNGYLQDGSRVPNGMHLHDDLHNSSYSSVFESENEDKSKEAKPCEVQQQQRSYDDRASVHSNSCCGDPPEHKMAEEESSTSNYSSTLSFSSGKAPSMKQYDSVISLHRSATSCLDHHSRSLVSINSDIVNEQIRNSTHSLKLDCLDSVTDCKDGVIETEANIRERFVEEMPTIPFDRLQEEEQMCCLLEDKRISMHFGKLESISESKVSIFDALANEAGAKSDSESASSRTIQRKIEFEVEELPVIEDSDTESLGRRSATPDRKRTETSLRIGIPKLISVSSIDSEPISPIIISIDPDDKEFSMMEAEIDFSDDYCSE